MKNLLVIFGVILAMLAVEGIVVFAHHMQRRFGTMLLGAFGALSVFSISFFAAVVPLVRLTPTLTIPLLSVIFYLNILVALLIVYVCDGTNYARRFLSVLLGGYALALLLQEIIRLVSPAEAFFAINPLPQRLFEQNWRIYFAAILTLLFAFALVLFFYQLLANQRPSWPRGVRIMLVLGVVFLLDGLFFTVVAFSGHARLQEFLLSQLLTKSAATLILAPGAAFYITRVLRAQSAPGEERRPVFDVVRRVTEMDREMSSLLATMVDGLIIYNRDGLITRYNPAAERLLGRTLQGLRLDDPSFRLTLPDGERMPHSDSPLLNALRFKQPVENVELGVRQDNGKLRILSVNTSPIFDSQNRLRGALATFRDITQRKEVDESLAASQDFLSRLIEQAPTGIAVFDRQGMAERFNKVFLNMLGAASSTELMGQLNLFKEKMYMESDLLRYFVKAYKGTAVEIPPKVIDLERKKILDLAAYDWSENGNTGAVKVVSHFIYPMYDRDGKVDRVVALINDLTEHTRAEQQRQQIAERYQNMVAHISDFLFSAKVVQSSLQYEFCTAAVEKITGFAEEYFLNDNWFWFTIIDTDDKQRVQEELGRLIRKREIQEGNIEYRIRARGGETRWVQTRFTFLRDAAGEVERLLGAVSDITRSKEAEDALRKTVTRFRSLVDSLNDFVLSVDLEGKITFANQAFNKIFDQRSRTMIGKDLYRYINSEDREPIIKHMQDLIKTNKPIRQHELRLHKPQGDYLWLRVNAEPLFDDAGVMNNVMVVATDVTESKRVERTLQQQNGALTLLEEVTEKVAARMPEQEICERIGSQIPAILGCDAVFLGRWEAARQSFTVVAGVEPADLRAAQQCCESGQPLLWNEEAAPGNVDVNTARIKALAAVPIMNPTRVLGVLQVSSSHETRIFNADTVRYLAILARKLAEVCEH